LIAADPVLLLIFSVPLFNQLRQGLFMKPFSYHPLMNYGKDSTVYEKIGDKAVSVKKAFGKEYLFVQPEALADLTEKAFQATAHYLRTSHLKQMAAILSDAESSENDRFVASALLKNAVIAAGGVLPMCQDTGTAHIVAFKGEAVQTGCDDGCELSRGVWNAYTRQNYRYSQMVPLSLFEEVNSGTNLPAQIDIASVPGNEYHFLFMAKGGGSANKSALFQETREMLTEGKLEPFLKEKIKGLGVAACPPYRLAIVIGGTSPDLCLKTVKLASAGYLDHLPFRGTKGGIAFRDRDWEKRVLKIAQESGLGAQFCGKHLALSARVIRLPRHAASCPIGIGVSCNADRNIKAKITSKGIFLEKLERNPARFLKAEYLKDDKKRIEIDLNQSIQKIIQQLKGHPVGSLVSLTGPLVVARDMAHARLGEQLDKTGKLPDYFKNHPIYYAGPAKTPKGMASGSFGPTTAERMDGYLEAFMKQGASLITVAKGNRSVAVSKACKKYQGFYLGTIGGAAALLAQENIIKSEVMDFEDLGMEAIRRMEVRNLPAFILSDTAGKNLYSSD